MNTKELKQLLEDPEVSKILQEELSKALDEKEKELAKKEAELNESIKKAEKQLFVTKKMLVAKTALYEQKLKDFYEEKFQAAVKKIGADTFSYINESAKRISNTVLEESKKNTEVTQLKEAFGNAVRAMAPFMKINELVGENKETVAELKDKLNAVIKEKNKLAEKVLSDEIETLVVSECQGYPLEAKKVVIETLKEIKPKTIVEAKSAIQKIKASFRAKEEAAAAQASQTEETKVVTESTNKEVIKVASKANLKKLVEETLAKKPSETSGNSINDKFDYDFIE